MQEWMQNVADEDRRRRERERSMPSDVGGEDTDWGDSRRLPI